MDLDIIDKWKSEKDAGIYDAMNKGIDLCQGNFIGMLNAGDKYTTNGLAIIDNYFNNNALIFEYDIYNRDNLLSLYNKFSLQKINEGSISFKDIFFPLSIEIWLRSIKQFVRN